MMDIYLCSSVSECIFFSSIKHIITPICNALSYWSGTWISRRLVLVCNGRGLRKGHSCSLGLHSTVFQTEIYTIYTCVIETIERGYMHRNVCIVSNSQADIKALDNFQMNSKLVWDATSPWLNWQNITCFTSMGARICGNCQK